MNMSDAQFETFVRGSGIQTVTTAGLIQQDGSTD